LTAEIVIPAAEPLTIIKIINHTGGEINIKLGKSTARMMNNEDYAINIRSLEIPSLEVESTKATAGYWWTPITVNITEQFNTKYGRSPVGENIIIEVTSSRLHGYSANINLSKEPIQIEKTSYENMDSPWDAFPAIRKEYLTPGLVIKATYQNYGEVRNLLDSIDEAQKPNRIRLARLMLGLPTSYTQEDINRHFRELSLKYHPDRIPVKQRNERNTAISTTIIKLLGRAREILLEQ
jgi:hypothetical protein